MIGNNKLKYLMTLLFQLFLIITLIEYNLRTKPDNLLILDNIDLYNCIRYKPFVKDIHFINLISACFDFNSIFNFIIIKIRLKILTYSVEEL